MSATPEPNLSWGAERLARFAQFLGLTSEAFGTAGRAWLHVGKTVGAALLALYLSMRLELPQPRTAMTTVFIVMQPQSGAVLAKSFYRLAGTAVGLTATLAIVALCAQSREMYLLATASWMACCTIGAARNRNLRAYGFVLAGYTAALVGLPNVLQPLDAFDAGVTRALEVTLGILCATVISAVVFPQYTSTTLRAQVRARYQRFVEFVREAAGGRIARSQLESRNMAFVSDVVGLEAMRSMASFEDPESRQRSSRLARMNSEFMAASTRLHALHQLMQRILAHGDPRVAEALEPSIRGLATMLTVGSESVRNAADASQVCAQLARFRGALPREIRRRRIGLRRAGVGAEALLDFDTGSELLYRLAGELDEYTQTYASLEKPRHERGALRLDFQPRTGWVSAGVAGMRTFLSVIAISVLWIGTDWPLGWYALLNGATVCALIAPSPRPARLAVQMSVGATVAVLLGYIVSFEVMPHIDGFVLLALAFAPILAVGTALSLKPKWSGMAQGFLIFFAASAGPSNLPDYDPQLFLEQGVALLVGLILAALAFSIILPPTSKWMIERMMKDLRRQVSLACYSAAPALSHRFDAQTRDTMYQLGALTSDQPALYREALGWMLSVLEVGQAMISLRVEIEGLPPHLRREARYSPQGDWRRAARALRDRISELFARPNAQRFAVALAAGEQAAVTTHAMFDGGALAPDERHRLQRALSAVHFVRAALLDPQSPLSRLGSHPLSPAMPSDMPSGDASG